MGRMRRIAVGLGGLVSLISVSAAAAEGGALNDDAGKSAQVLAVESAPDGSVAPSADPQTAIQSTGPTSEATSQATEPTVDAASELTLPIPPTAPTVDAASELTL